MKKNSTQNRGAAWIISSLAPIMMMLFMVGTPAFGQLSVTNSTGITIGAESVIGTPAEATPYPSIVTVTAPPTPGTLEKVTVTLNGFSHQYPNDVVALLVGPNNQSVILMGNAGNGQPVSGLTLTFDDAASGPLQLASPISSGTYQPGNNTPDDDGKSYGSITPFPLSAPQTVPYDTTLAQAFTSGPNALGSSYGGQWKLYIIDTSQPSTGSIANWVLNLYTTPTITGTSTTSLVFNENTSGVLTFTNSDASSNAMLKGSIINLTTAPGNPQPGGFALITNSSSDFTFSPTINPNGTSTLTLTPSPNMWGGGSFMFVITDGQGTSTSSTINFTVTHVPQPPAISLSSTTITTSNEVASSTNLMTLVSVDGNGANNLSLSVTSPGQGNVQVETTVFTNTTLVSLNTNVSLFSVLPNGFPVGATNLNFIVKDNGDGLSTTQLVTVLVQPLTIGISSGPLVFTNTNSIAIASGSVGNPTIIYDPIMVTNLTGLGKLGTVSVSLLGLSNTVPSGLRMAVYSPSGWVVPLLLNPAGGSSVTNAEVTFFDGGGATAPVNPGNTLPNGNILTNYVENSAGSAEIPPISLLSLGGTSPTNVAAANVWYLIITNTSSAASAITAGWALDLYPAPLITLTNPTLTTLDSTPGNLFVTNDEIIVSSVLSVPSGPPSVTIPVGLADNDTPVATYTIVSNSTANVGGTNFTTYMVYFTNNINEFTTNGTPIPITITSIDTNNLQGATPLPYNITFVDQPPSISFISEQVTYSGTPVLNIPFSVSSPDMNASSMTVMVSSDNQAVLATANGLTNYVITPVGASAPPPPAPSTQDYLLSLFPTGVKQGQANVTITVSDGLTTTKETFLLYVQGPGNPVFYNPSAIPISVSPTGSPTPGSPYPSPNVVSGLVGTVGSVVVSVYDVTYNNAAGLNVLLVGPSGQTVLLMGGVATNTQLNSATLVFSNTAVFSGGFPTASVPGAANPLIPEFGTVGSGFYTPTNYIGGSYLSQAPLGPPNPPAPGGGYGYDLTNFFDTDPNGTWNLYAWDTNGIANGGGLIKNAIFGGWQLSIVTAPEVSPTTNYYSTLENVAANVVVPVGDAELGNPTFTVTTSVVGSNGSPPVVSAGTATIAVTNITLSSITTSSNTEEVATLAIQPNAYEFGTNVITVHAANSAGASTASFTFVVVSNSQPPVFSGLVTGITSYQVTPLQTNLTTPAAITLSNVIFSVWDAQTTNGITVSATSSNPSLVPNANISIVLTNGAFTNGLFIPGANLTGTNVYAMTITPAGVQPGTAQILVTALDSVGQKATLVFNLTITSNLAFAGGGIVIDGGSGSFNPGLPQNDLANPYPSTITVANVGGIVTNVTVELQGLTDYPAVGDIQALLESPNGATVVLMAGAGGITGATNLNLTFNQFAATELSSSGPLASGAYQPSDYESGVVFSNPAPQTAPYSANLATFNGGPANGNWNLYIQGSQFGDNGTLANWVLLFKTGPQITAIPTNIVAENTIETVQLNIADSTTAVTNLVVTASSDNPAVAVSVVNVTNLVITPQTNYPSAVEITSNEGLNVTNTITVTVKDTVNSLSTVTTFTNVIQYINQAPVVVNGSNGMVIIPENGSASIYFTNYDVDSYLSYKNLTITTTNPVAILSISSNANTVLNGSTFYNSNSPGIVTVTVTPTSETFGTNQLLYILSDTNGNQMQNVVTIVVTHTVQPPLSIATVSGVSAVSGGSATVTFTNRTLEPNATLTVTAVSSDSTVVPNSPLNIIINPSTIITGANPSGAILTNTGTIELIPIGAPTTPKTTVITLTLTQVAAGPIGNVTQTTITSFTLTLVPAANVFASTTPVANTAGNPLATPYPSTITVPSGLGRVVGMTLTLNLFSASNPSDVNLLLVAPDGNATLLLSGAGGTSPVSDLTLGFNDASNLAPDGSALGPNSSTVFYHPTSYNSETNPFPLATGKTPTNPPTPPFFDRLAIFDGSDPTGSWNLYAYDTTTGDTMSIANGWTLSISTGPQIVVTQPTSLPLHITESQSLGSNIGTFDFSVVDTTGTAANDVVTATASPSSLITTTLEPPTMGTNYTALIGPIPFTNGIGMLTVVVSNSATGFTLTTNLAVVVDKVNIAPALTRLSTVTTGENQVATQEFFVTEIGDPLKDVTVAAFSGNTALIGNSNLTFLTGLSAEAGPGIPINNNVVNLASFASSTAPNSGDLELSMLPNPNAIGSTTITIYATNIDNAVVGPTTNVTMSTFTFNVKPATFAPTFVGVPTSPVSVIGGQSGSITFVVDSADNVAPTIGVTATVTSGSGVTVGTPTATNTTASVSGSTTNYWTAGFTAAPTTVPTKAFITLTATDSVGENSTSTFQVNVVPDQQHFYSNSTYIGIADSNPSYTSNAVTSAGPMPSTINISGLVGTVSQVIVSVNGFAHQFPSDVGMLLVGPAANGGDTNTMLMRFAGDGYSVSGLNLTFEENVTTLPPTNGAPLTSTTYGPSDYYTPKSLNFATSYTPNSTLPASLDGVVLNPPPPSSPYATNLNVFNGANPNGNWYLYVEDESAGDIGAITNGWSLQIFTQPLIQISGLTNISVSEVDACTNVSFTILDDSPPSAINYTTNSFHVTSSNTALVPVGNVSFTGSGTSWSASLCAVPNVIGSSLITIFSTNSYSQVASNSFVFTVLQQEEPPLFESPANGSVITIQAGSPTTIPLIYSDVGFSASQLVVSATSTPLGDQNPIPSVSLGFVGNGSGPSNLVITSFGDILGSNSITVTVTQPTGVGTNSPISSSTTFTVVVAPSSVPVFVNTNLITINANLAATPYPSLIDVENVVGNVYKVTATFFGFTHTFPSDVSALLVGPEGQNVVLMSDEGDGVGVSNLRFTFDDAGVAMSPTGPLTNGTFAPTNSDYYRSVHGVDITFPPSTAVPAVPAQPYGHDLGVFSNTMPNGIWALYIYDTNIIDTGTISGGWSLSIQTVAPAITPISPVTTPENTPVTVPFSVSSAATYASNITVTATATNEIPANLVSSLVIGGAETTNETLTITPATNYPSAVTNINGTATIVLTATDTNGNVTTTLFQLTVTYTDIAPTIVLPVAQTSTPANGTLTVPLIVTDVQQTANVVVTASLSTNLGSVSIAPDGPGAYTLTFTPDGLTGVEVVSIVATDGTVSSTNTLQITVTPGQQPVVNIVSATNMPENSTLAVPFTVANVPVTFPSDSGDIIDAVASNTNLVASITLVGAGSNFTATINLVPYTFGTSTITIAAGDTFGTAQNIMNLTVTPVEFPPTLAPIPDTNTTENIPVNVVLNVTDVATSVTNLTFTNNISNPSVIKAVTFSFNGANEVATVIPATNATGVAAVTIIVSDGVTNVSQAFAVTVNASAPPGSPTLQAALTFNNGMFVLSFKGTPGATYNIQSSANLVSWGTVATVIADPTTGQVTYNAVVSNSSGGVFYRVEAP